MHDIIDLGHAVIEALNDYPNQDPAELVEELVRVMARDEELSFSDETRLLDTVWDLLN